ncbi:hypothetical protein Q5H92_19590 [Hymenobacter sp. M29]|uniref:F5/8 type C domain-containing protein n=1 Tax=Hymenobacter mellowenesis TaxID=3063995 RepID=A0ABT9AFE0_9BACT|nr:hypothetical protein [Hymenobacter sp. M29]MDO7848579.1 hypothetical protein [Hymenobacter sp. M29]
MKGYPLSALCHLGKAGALLAVMLLALAGPARAQQTPVAFDSVYTTQPVELVYFTAELYYGGGQLHWTTLREGNILTYVIEQSRDARTWETLSTMEAHPGYAARYDYVYMDLHIHRYGVPRVYYRLRQLAQDGTFTYSPVRCIRLDEPAARVAQSPPAQKPE